MGAETNHIVDWSAIERCRFDDEIVRVHFAQAQIIEQFGPFSTAYESSREYEIEQFIQPAFRQPFQTGQFSSKKHDLGFALMNQLASAHKRFPTSEQDIAADFFALRKSYEGNRWSFSEGRNRLNPASHCDIAWAGALATHAHLENRFSAAAL